ncbi:hypothetical protein POPTR_003G189601v4 [Populus trichocarpa]|uniref:Uncharacterized protein n=1 Tax=Populus trichocarpa TaxID=3694 RepID=A0ACC0TAF8_POPTR|nr:hypothetical protein BDE02_03G173500 [Populus trichocarpa]KAI9398501.1 hypothetical protein POPTR_003G189601v4 [Populus trichocarpa]
MGRLCTAVATDPPSGSISLDHGAISVANDPVTKRHRPFKHEFPTSMITQFFCL